MATHRLARYCRASNGISRSGRSGKVNVELWMTPCIVTFPIPDTRCLLVPSNERLCGTQFSHFPRGGPTPSQPLIGVPKPTKREDILTSSSSSPSSSITATGPDRNENGEDVGTDSVTTTTTTATTTTTTTTDTILYPCESIDGTITELIGPKLHRYIEQNIPNLSENPQYPIRCPTGSARMIPSIDIDPTFQSNYPYLVFAVAPFYNNTNNNAKDEDDDGSNWEQLLTNAYLESFRLAAETATSASAPTTRSATKGGKDENGSIGTKNTSRRHNVSGNVSGSASTSIAVPLLGSGTRGIPHSSAARIASLATYEYSLEERCDADVVAQSHDKNHDTNNNNNEPIPSPQRKPDIADTHDGTTMKTNLTIRFAVQDEDVAEIFDDELCRIYDHLSS